MASEQGMGLLLSRSLCDLFNTSVNCTNVLICTRTQNIHAGFHAASYLSEKGFKGFKCWLIWGTCKLSDPNLLQTVEHGTEGSHGQSAKYSYSYVFLMLGPIWSHNLQSLDFVWMAMMNQSLKAWHSVWQMDFAGKHWRAAGSSTWTCAEAQRGASSIQLELVFERLTSLNPNAPILVGVEHFGEKLSSEIRKILKGPPTAENPWWDVLCHQAGRQKRSWAQLTQS